MRTRCYKAKNQITEPCWHCSLNITSPVSSHGCSDSQLCTCLISFSPVCLSVQYIKYLKRDWVLSARLMVHEAISQLIRYYTWSRSDILPIRTLFFCCFFSLNSWHWLRLKSVPESLGNIFKTWKLIKLNLKWQEVVQWGFTLIVPHD